MKLDGELMLAILLALAAGMLTFDGISPIHVFAAPSREPWKNTTKWMIKEW